jgi:hypothetical protein
MFILRYMLYNKLSTLEKTIMNTSLNITAFNYQNEIKMANTLFDQDEDGRNPFQKSIG